VIRDPSKAATSAALGVRLIASDLGTSGTIREAMTGCDAAIHIAGMYEVGIPVGVTYWASHAKATAELGFAPRDLATGARDAFGPH